MYYLTSSDRLGSPKSGKPVGCRYYGGSIRRGLGRVVLQQDPLPGATDHIESLCLSYDGGNPGRLYHDCACRVQTQYTVAMKSPLTVRSPQCFQATPHFPAYRRSRRSQHIDCFVGVARKLRIRVALAMMLSIP